MNMKILKIFSFIILATLIVSCGSGSENTSKKKIVLTPETTKIKGDLGEFFTVVDKEYTTTFDDILGHTLAVEVECTDDLGTLSSFAPYGTSEDGILGHAGFGIEILDENGTLLIKKSIEGFDKAFDSDDIKEVLKLKEGESGIIRCTFKIEGESNPTKFRLTSATEEVEQTVESDKTSESTSDFDKVTKDIEDELNKTLDDIEKTLDVFDLF